MNKKFLSLVLALVMVLGTLTPVFAEEAAPKDKIEKAAKTAPSAKVQWLVDEKIVSGRKLFKDGDEKTDLSLDKNLQRDEITRLLVLGKGLENLANLVQGTMRPYVDVDNSNWANGVITVGSYHLKNAQGVPMLAGYPGNKFLPTRNVSYAELAKMLVCLVDNSITPKMVENFQWPSDWMVRAANLGILAGVDVKDSKAFVTRQAAFEMLYNAMYLYDTRHNVDYGTKFGVVSGYANGELKLNQGDKAFTVKYSGETVYVNNSGYATYMPLAGEYKGLVIGSLVRVIADKDGNATHIVEMGNPVNGAISGRWFGVADSLAQGFADFKDAFGDKSDRVLTIKDGSWMTNAQVAEYNKTKTTPLFPAKTIGKTVQVNLTSKTRFFVADANRNYLTEVDQAKAQDLVKKSYYIHNTYQIPNVYVGYDTNNDVRKTHINNEARIVVFNVVYKSFRDYETVRVTQPSNGVYNFSAENKMGDVAEYSLRHYAGSMPGFERAELGYPNKTAGYRGEFEKLNVLALDLNKDTKEVLRTAVLINYATDPSFLVKEQSQSYAGVFYLTLQGKEGHKLVKVRVIEDDTTFFTEGNRHNLVGKYIQVAAENPFYDEYLGGNEKEGYFFKNDTMVSVVSVLDHAKNLAKINPAHGQNELELTVEFTKPVEEDPVVGYRVKARDVRFNVPSDPEARELIANAKDFYYLTKEDRDLVNGALEAYKAPVTFTATVVVNRPGETARLDVDKIVAPEIKAPVKTLVADYPNISAQRPNSERYQVEKAISKANGFDGFGSPLKFTWTDKGVTVTHDFMKTRTFTNEEVARAPYEYKVTFVVPNGTLTIGTTKYEPNPTEAVGVLKVLENANKVTTLPTAVPNENTKTFKQWTIKGTTDKFDATTEVTKDITVVAEWN